MPPLPPPERYSNLPKETREFLERLHEDDIELLEQSIRFMRSALSVGWFFKWVALTAVAAFIMGGQIMDAFVKIKTWFIK